MAWPVLVEPVNNLDDLVSAEISLGEVNQGYEMIRDPKVNRVVITDFS